MSEKETTYDATPKQVAEAFNVSPRSVLRWAENCKVPFCQTPIGPRFNIAELKAHFRREPNTA